MISKLMYKPHITCLSKDIIIQNGKTLTTDAIINKTLTNGSEVYCIDTSECYLYDEENKTLIKTKVNSDIVIDGEITPESVNIINTKVDNFIKDVNDRIDQADIEKVVELGERIDNINDIIGDEEMGTDVDTVKGAIAEHSTYLNQNTQEIQKLNGYKTSTDLNDEGEVGKLTVTKAASATLNTPNKQGLTGVLACVVFTYKNSNDYGIQVALGSGSNDIFIRKYSTDGWGLWFKNLVNEDSGWIDLPLASNMTAASSDFSPKYRKIGNVVRLDGRISGVTATADNVSVTLASLPAGFRPFRVFKSIVASAGKGTGYYKININTNGTVVITGSTDDLTTTDHISLDGLSFTVN